MKKPVRYRSSLLVRFKKWLRSIVLRWKKREDASGNLENFPIMNVKEVALVRAEIATGILLDEACNYAVYPHQKVYTVFENIDKGLKYARQIIEEKRNIECVLYGIDQRVLHCVNCDNFESY
ncbi:hypothetical protein [Pedobacter gandavensis]|uniref:hypothetical protein n=1 Tax=Pedobacter gandavensis TaxID=2679963 RepID=UPI00292EB251|nr:hypothetical protein [Pedobacter gandavensis]